MSVTTQILRQLETSGERLPSGLPGGRGTVHLAGGGTVRGIIALTEYWVIVALDAPDDRGRERICAPRERVTSVDFDFVEEAGDDGAAREAGE
jgi:hypothetical protein